MSLDEGGESGEFGDTSAGSTSGSTDEGNDVPFELESAWIDATGKFVGLRFSEDLGPTAGIDPSDFRISYASVVSWCEYDGCVDRTEYWDPNAYADYYSPNVPPNVHRFEADLVGPGNASTDLVLRFEQPLNPGMCDLIDYNEAGYDMLYVHYSPGEIPVTSGDGESLAAIGLAWADWAGEPEFWMVVDGEFPDLDPKISIACGL